MTRKQLQKQIGDHLVGDYLFSRNDRVSLLIAERDGILMAHNGGTEWLGLGWHTVDTLLLCKLGY